MPAVSPSIDIGRPRALDRRGGTGFLPGISASSTASSSTWRWATAMRRPSAPSNPSRRAACSMASILTGDGRRAAIWVNSLSPIATNCPCSCCLMVRRMAARALPVTTKPSQAGCGVWPSEVSTST